MMIKTIYFICSVLIISYLGCEPLSLEEPERDRDVVADVLAVVCPDSVTPNQTFPVQISYRNVCGGTLKNVIIVYNDTLNKVFVQPILHQVVQNNCSGENEIRSISALVKFTRSVEHELTVIGNYSAIQKRIDVSPTGPRRINYNFSFRFQNRSGTELPGYNATLQFLTTPPGSIINITADENGIWDTTFVYSELSLDYTFSGFQFSASKNVAENGIVVIP